MARGLDLAQPLVVWATPQNQAGSKLKDMHTRMMCGTRAEFQVAMQGMTFTGKINDGLSRTGQSDIT